MKFSKLSKAGALAALAAVALSACSAQNESNTDESNGSGQAEATLSGELIGAGASSQGAAQETWIAGFQTKHEGVSVNYDPVGSGGGRETFQQNASAFAGSDRAFKLEELASGEFGSCAPDSDLVQFPAYISPISLVFNVEGVESLNLDAATLADIFTGEITKWNDSEITRQNPDATLPDLAITAVHRSDKSGTTGNFTDYLAQAAPDQWTEGSIEEWPTEFGGEGANGTSGVIEAVTNGIGTIGYADASRAGTLSTVNVLVGQEYVSYSPEAAAKIIDASKVEDGRSATDIVIDLERDTEASGVYPIVLVSYLIGCQTYNDASTATLVKEYFSYIVSEEGQNAAAASAGNAPISAQLRTQVQAAIDSIN